MSNIPASRLHFPITFWCGKSALSAHCVFIVWSLLTLFLLCSSVALFSINILKVCFHEIASKEERLLGGQSRSLQDPHPDSPEHLGMGPGWPVRTMAQRYFSEKTHTQAVPESLKFSCRNVLPKWKPRCYYPNFCPFFNLQKCFSNGI